MSSPKPAPPEPEKRDIQQEYEKTRVRDRPTFIQLIGSQFGKVLLGFIVGLTTIFVLVWASTLPSIDAVRALLGPSAPPNDVIETWRTLRKDHFEQFRDLYQLVVISALVPLFTLVAGYAFGSREGQQRKPDDNES